MTEQQIVAGFVSLVLLAAVGGSEAYADWRVRGSLVRIDAIVWAVEENREAADSVSVVFEVNGSRVLAILRTDEGLREGDTVRIEYAQSHVDRVRLAGSNWDRVWAWFGLLAPLAGLVFLTRQALRLRRRNAAAYRPDGSRVSGHAPQET
ncbi:MAG: hypothetical protein ABIM89_03145 [Mycobacteriales bacterium]